MIRDFIPDEKVDVTLLLAVCAWIKNGDQVIEFVSKISTTLLFETNGNETMQNQQYAALLKGYDNVDLLHQIFGAKDGQKYVQRSLYFCY